METIRLRGPGDVLACLPYQLGYQPRDSLVVVALEERRVGMIQRLDLPRPDDVVEAARTVVEALERNDVEAALLVGYEDQQDASAPLVEAVALLMAREDIRVVDRVVVRDGRWYVLDCPDGCCPVDGEPLPAAADVPAVADFVALGAAPLPDRAALTDLVAEDPTVADDVGTVLDAAGHVVGARVPRRTRHEAATATQVALEDWRVALDLAGDGPPVDRATATEVAGLVQSLADLQVRDGLIAWLCPGSLPLGDLEPDVVEAFRDSLPVVPWAPPGWGAAPEPAPVARRRGGRPPKRARGRARPNAARSPGAREVVVAERALVARLQWLARAVPDEHAAPVLSLLGNVAWWFGDGALARVALDRALQHTPTYTLARLVAQLLDHGVRPGGPWSGRRGRRDPRLV